ncbi:MAG: phosphate/phosphite/phosphonate ABC transporter substrate-binding protein [Peptococcaceae bacterium]|jgi:phosphonate transport system substrate-binding protein|nr:phosphate/phosphite/phosphonate ABC transporter substrate-binding protein [Peptococcaceae bacterium]
MRYLKKMGLMVLLGVFVCVAGACAGGAGPDAPSGSPAETNAGAAPAAQAVAASYKETVEGIVICYLPNEGSEEYAEYRGMLQKEMGDYLGIQVTEINGADYNAVVEAMRAKHADIAAFGPVSYVQAVDRAGAEALVTAVPHGDRGLAGYTSKIIVKAGGPIQTLEDLRGKTFAFVDPASTSGNYVPTLELMNAFPGMTNEDFHTNGVFFASASFSGKHQNGLQAVLNGDVDAAPIASDILAAEIAAGRVSESDITVIHESPRIPSSPMGIRGDLPDDLKAAVKEFFLNYQNGDYFQYMVGLAPEEEPRYIESFDSDYDYVRDLMAKVIPE